MEWEGLFSILSDFETPGIMLMGGLLRTRRSVDERGCLGYLRYRLRKDRFNVVEIPELIFTPESFNLNLQEQFESFVYNPL